MRNVAQHIDQVKRNLEQQSRVRELSGILDGWLGPELTVLGDLVLEGILSENGKPRTVLLFETMLIITKKKEDNRLQFKTYINVSISVLSMRVSVCVRFVFVSFVSVSIEFHVGFTYSKHIQMD